MRGTNARMGAGEPGVQRRGSQTGFERRGSQQAGGGGGRESLGTPTRRAGSQGAGNFKISRSGESHGDSRGTLGEVSLGSSEARRPAPPSRTHAPQWLRPSVLAQVSAPKALGSGEAPRVV